MKVLTLSLMVASIELTTAAAMAQELPDVIWEADAKARTVTFSPDGQQMYTGGLEASNPYDHGNIRKWDVPSRTLLYVLTTNGGSETLGLTNDIDVSPDGAAFSSAHGSVYCIPDGPCINNREGFFVWDSETGALRFELGTPDVGGIVQATSHSSDGRYIAYGLSRTNEDEIRIFASSDYALLSSYDGHDLGTFCVAFSPAENLLATGGWDGHIRLWDVEEDQLVRTLHHGSYTSGGYPISLSFTPDGSRLVSSGSGYDLRANVWEVGTGELIHSLFVDEAEYGGMARVAVSPNGQYVAAGITRLGDTGWEGAIRIWSLADGILRREYVEADGGANDYLTSIAFSSLADDWFAYTYNDVIKFARTDLRFGDDQPAAVADPGTSRSVVSIFPHPVRDAAILRYAIPAGGDVHLALFDAAGRQVRTMVDETLRGGVHEVQFDRGSLAAGLYFSRLRSAGYESIRKIVIAR